MQPSDFIQIATFKDKPILYRFPKPDHIELKFPFDRSLIQRTKDMGLNWREKDKIWHGEANAMFAKQIARLFPESKETLKARELLNEPSVNGWEPSAYLMEHQKHGAEIAKVEDRYCFWHQTGCGKTLTAVEIIKQKRVKALVVCPLSIIETAWLEDINRFAPEIKAVNLWRARKARNGRMGSAAWKALIESCQVGIINFDSFKIIKDELAACGFQMLIIDESSFVKNPKAQITKALTKFADRLPYVYLMSGTPAPNSEEEFFSQIRMVDPFLFGRNFYLFKSQWFEPTDWTGFKFRMKPNLREEFKRRVAKVSDFVEKHKVLDLPDRTFNIRKVFLSDAERKVYNQMARKMVAEIEEQEITAANAAVKVMKLREVTSGFLIDEEGKVSQFGKSKLVELMALLQEIGNRQVLIWIQFKYEAQLILEALSSKARVCNSTVSTIRQIENIQDFKAGKYQYLIAHPASIGHGNTLVNCSDAIYYSLSHSFEKHSQSADRNYRKGQKNQCSYYFLLADETLDEVIYRILHIKESRMRDVLDYNTDVEINKEVLEHVKQFK